MMLWIVMLSVSGSIFGIAVYEKTHGKLGYSNDRAAYLYCSISYCNTIYFKFQCFQKNFFPAVFYALKQSRQ